MSATDFYEWMLYEQIEPFGDRRGDLQAGLIAAIIANSNRTKETDKVWTPFDLMPKWDPVPEVRQSPEEQLAMMLLIQQSQNSIVHHNG